MSSQEVQMLTMFFSAESAFAWDSSLMDSRYTHGSEELHELVVTAPAEDAVGHDLDVFLIKRNTQPPTYKTELSSVCISNMSSSKSILFKEVRESRGVHATRLFKSCHVTQCSP